MSSNGGDKKSQIVAGAVREIVNSRAAEKLADAVCGLVQIPQNALDYIAGPKRIASVNAARSKAALEMAQTQAEIERLRVETGDFVLDREMRKTINRRAILAEAEKALPPPTENVSDEPVSKDFVHNFFDEFDGISDPDVHKIVGRLLANEVVRPGSFPRRTMRVLRDLESSDFALFSNMCRFCWNVGNLVPLVYEPNGEIYLASGLNFRKFNDLEALGLISFNAVAGYRRQKLPSKFNIGYGNIVVALELKDGCSEIAMGHVMLTDAGRRLAPLTNPARDIQFFNYVLEKFKKEGHTATMIGVTQETKAA